MVTLNTLNPYYTMHYPYTVERPGCGRSVSSHRYLRTAVNALSRYRAGARAQGGYSQDYIACDGQRIDSEHPDYYDMTRLEHAKYEASLAS